MQTVLETLTTVFLPSVLVFSVKGKLIENAETDEHFCGI